MHSFYFWMRVNSAVRKREERVLNAPLRGNGAILHAGSDARKQEIRARPPLKGLKEHDPDPKEPEPKAEQSQELKAKS